MLSKSNIIYDLFENIVLLNTDTSVIYVGNSLKKIFTENQIVVENSSKIITNKNRLDSFQNLLNDVININGVHSFNFINLKDEFILLPILDENSQILLLGQKEKIIQITKIGHELKELINELQCLYSVSKELETAKPLRCTLENCIAHLQKGFRFTGDVVVNIEFGKSIYGNLDWHQKEVFDILISDIKETGIKKGEIRVYKNNVGSFTEKEKKLIDEIAGKISRAIEKDEKEKNLEKQQLILKAKNDALLKLTSECNTSREKLKTFFKAITEKIIVIDRDFNIIMSNKDEIGENRKCYNALFDLKEICPNCPASITFNSSNDAVQELEFEEKFLILKTYPIFGEDGTVNRVLEVCRDKTNEKKMESQLLQSYKLASLGKLVAGVAHEINNPNTFILGNLKIVQEAFDDIFPILDEYITTNPSLKIARLNYDIFKENISILVSDMINGANRTKKIVNDLRNFAKKDEASLTDDIDLNFIITNNISLTLKHVKKYAELEFELEDNIPIFKGNAQRIEQVLHNLLLNASEAIEPNGGKVLVKTAYDKNTNQIVLIVHDNGCGIDEFTIKNIFDPFYTTKRNKGGTGLGLSITYGIIKDHYGTIEVESKVGQGTKFIIKIPIN